MDLEMNLTKNIQETYRDSFKTLIRDIEINMNIWREILCSWMETTRYDVRVSSLWINLYTQWHPNKNSRCVFQELGNKFILKFLWMNRTKSTWHKKSKEKRTTKPHKKPDSNTVLAQNRPTDSGTEWKIQKSDHEYMGGRHCKSMKKGQLQPA